MGLKLILNLIDQINKKRLPNSVAAFLNEHELRYDQMVILR